MAALALSAPAAASTLPAPVDLSPTTMSCVPTNGSSTRLGDDITCRLDVKIVSGIAVDTTADLAIPAGTGYDPTLTINLAGTVDNPLAPTTIHYDATRLGFVSSDVSRGVSFELRLRPDGGLAPGDLVAPVARVRADNGAEVTVVGAPITIMTSPADLTPSWLACDDLDGAPLRPGDTIDCSAHLEDLIGKEDAVDVTARVPMPVGTAWAPGGNETAHDDHAIWWDTSGVPGGVPSGDANVPALRFRLVIGASMWPGTLIAPQLNVFYTNSASRTGGSLARTAPALTTAPGPAVLMSSTMTCSDVNAPPLYAGDAISCALTAVDAAGHEDIQDLRGAAPVPDGTTPLPGTIEVAGRTFVLDSGLGTLASGAAKTLILRFRVDEATAPGTTIAPTAVLRGQSVGTGAIVGADLAAVPMTVVAPPTGLPTTPVAVVASSSGTPSDTGKPTSKPTTPPKTSRICASRRVVTVTAWPPKGQRWRSVKARFGTRSAKGRRWGSRRAYRIRLVFAGMPKGTMKIHITGRTTTGRTVRSTRSFRLCLPRL